MVPLMDQLPLPPTARACGKVPRDVCSTESSDVPSDGWEVEPDQRHVDLIVQELELTGANGVITPGDNEPRRTEREKAQGSLPCLI